MERQECRGDLSGRQFGLREKSCPAWLDERSFVEETWPCWGHSIGSSDPEALRVCWLAGNRPLPAGAALHKPVAARDAQDGADAGKEASGGQVRESRRVPVHAEKRIDVSEFYSQPGDDPPRAFVPLRPSSTDDRRRLEVVRLYSTGRALEDRRAWTDAVALLQEALKLEPDSIAVARRLSRIYIGALGRADLAVEYGKRVLAAEPGDSETLSQLVEYYRRNDPPGAEALLNDVLANPKLEQHAPARLLARIRARAVIFGPSPPD